MHTSDGIVKGLLGKVAGLIGGVQDLVVEDGEVEGEAKADGVGGGQVGLGNLSGVLVGLKGLVGRLVALVANGELGKVTVVVTLPTRMLTTWDMTPNEERLRIHLVVEDLRLAALGRGN